MTRFSNDRRLAIEAISGLSNKIEMLATRKRTSENDILLRY
jgi:hypothetical protein